MAKQILHTFTDDFALQHCNGGAYTNKEIDQWCKKMAKKYGVEFKVLAYHGQGGGWPCLRVKGKDEALKQFLAKEYYCCNVDELTQEVGVNSIDELWD